MILEIRNFRGISDKTFEFQEGITLISGDSGNCKTTVLESIEWCLYGGQGFKPSDRSTNETEVTIQSHSTTIKRRGMTDVSILHQGEEFKKGEAAAKIIELFGPKDVWKSASYISQKGTNHLIELKGEAIDVLRYISSDIDESEKVFSIIDTIKTDLAQKRKELSVSLQRSIGAYESGIKQYRTRYKKEFDPEYNPRDWTDEIPSLESEIKSSEKRLEIENKISLIDIPNVSPLFDNSFTDEALEVRLKIAEDNLPLLRENLLKRGTLDFIRSEIEELNECPKESVAELRDCLNKLVERKKNLERELSIISKGLKYSKIDERSLSLLFGEDRERIRNSVLLDSKRWKLLDSLIEKYKFTEIPDAPNESKIDLLERLSSVKRSEEERKSKLAIIREMKVGKVLDIEDTKLIDRIIELKRIYPEYHSLEERIEKMSVVTESKELKDYSKFIPLVKSLYREIGTGIPDLVKESFLVEKLSGDFKDALVRLVDSNIENLTFNSKLGKRKVVPQDIVSKYKDISSDRILEIENELTLLKIENVTYTLTSQVLAQLVQKRDTLQELKLLLAKVKESYKSALMKLIRAEGVVCPNCGHSFSRSFGSSYEDSDISKDDITSLEESSREISQKILSLETELGELEDIDKTLSHRSDIQSSVTKFLPIATLRRLSVIHNKDTDIILSELKDVRLEREFKRCDFEDRDLGWLKSYRKALSFDSMNIEFMERQTLNFSKKAERQTLELRLSNLRPKIIDLQDALPYIDIDIAKLERQKEFLAVRKKVSEIEESLPRDMHIELEELTREVEKIEVRDSYDSIDLKEMRFLQEHSDLIQSMMGEKLGRECIKCLIDGTLEERIKNITKTQVILDSEINFIEKSRDRREKRDLLERKMMDMINSQNDLFWDSDKLIVEDLELYIKSLECKIKIRGLKKLASELYIRSPKEIKDMRSRLETMRTETIIYHDHTRLRELGLETEKLTRDESKLRLKQVKLEEYRIKCQELQKELLEETIDDINRGMRNTCSEIFSKEIYAELRLSSTTLKGIEKFNVNIKYFRGNKKRTAETKKLSCGEFDRVYIALAIELNKRHHTPIPMLFLDETLGTMEAEKRDSVLSLIIKNFKGVSLCVLHEYDCPYFDDVVL